MFPSPCSALARQVFMASFCFGSAFQPRSSGPGAPVKMTQIRDFSRGLGGDSEAQACVQAVPASIKPPAATPAPRNSRLVQCSHIGISSLQLRHALTDQKLPFE